MFKNLKKISIFLSAVLVALSSITTCFSAPWIDINITYNGKTERYNAENVYLYINGKRIENISMPPIIINGSTLVPAREVFEPLGATVSWKKDTEEVIISYKETTIIIKINSNTATVNNSTEPLSMPAKIINNKTMIPARFIAQSLGLKVEWDKTTRIINIREFPNEPINPIIEIPIEEPTVSKTEETTEQISEHSSEETTERDAVNLNSPSCEDGIFKITANGSIGDFAGPSKRGKKLTYILSKTNPPKKDTYSFDDDYIKKVSFNNITINNKNFTEVTLHLTENNTPVEYISKDEKSFIVDFVNDAPKYDDLYAVNLDDEPLASDIDVSNYDNSNQFAETPSLSEISSDKNLFFENETLYIKKNSSLNLSSITEIDNYSERNYVIDTNCDLSSLLKSGKYEINNDKIDYVEITHNQTTKITIYEKKVFAYTLSENNEYICIKPISPKEKYQKIVVIDAGHGGDDPGAQANNIQEKELNLSIAQKTVDLLEKNNNIKVYAIRLTDVFYTRPERAEFANDLGDLFISIHANSFTAEKANGTEVWFWPHENDTTTIACQNLAEILQKHLINNLKSTNRGVKSTNYDVLTLTKIPAALCEIGFITNSAEAANLKNDEYRNLAAQAIYQSIIEVFEKYTPQR